MHIRHIIHILIATIALASLSGCRSQRSSLGETTYPAAADTSLTDRYRALCASYADGWDRLEIPVKVSLQSPSRIGLSGRAYMQRGESVFISLRMLGLEVATLHIDSDSVRVAEKYHKIYLCEDVKPLLAATGLTLADLQDALLGRAFEIGQGTVAEAGVSRFLLTEGQDAWTMTPRRQPSGASYAFTIDSRDNALELLTVLVDGRDPASAAYSSPVETAKGRFASAVNLEAAIGDQLLKVVFEWDFRSARWDPASLKQWRQPSASYKRLRAADLLKSIQL